MTEPHEPYPTPTEESRAAYRERHYRQQPAVWKNTDWRCQCETPHAQPWFCLGDDIVIAYWCAFPETRYRIVRMMAWMNFEWGGTHG